MQSPRHFTSPSCFFIVQYCLFILTNKEVWIPDLGKKHCIDPYGQSPMADMLV